MENNKRIEHYCLSDGTYGYLVSGQGNITVNGNPVVSGTVLTEPGTYYVKCQGAGEYEKAIVLHTGNTYTETKMPISAFYGPFRRTITTESRGDKQYDYLTDEIYRLIQGTGIKRIVYTDHEFGLEEQRKDVLQGLELAEKYGLEVYIQDNRTGRIRNDVELAECMADYASYASFKGYSVIDEPFSKNYGGQFWSEEYRRMEYYAERARELNRYCNLIGNVNLNPKAEWLSSTDLDKDYDDYVEQYIQSYDARALSFDYYVFDQLINPACYATEEGYFNNLAVMRDKSLKYDIPFWTFIQAGSNWNDGAIDLPKTNNDIPTKYQMFWNVNTSLAYGTKGIQYFPLIQPFYFAYEENGGFDFERNGVIGANGVPTKWYAYIQEMNQHISEVDEILMGAKSLKVLASGENACKVTNLFEASYQNILQGIQTEQGAIVGVFDYSGKAVFYVVNYDYENPQRITLKFVAKQKVSVIAHESQLHGRSEISARECVLYLQAGGAALVACE